MPTVLETMLNIKIWDEDLAKEQLAIAIKELSDAEYELQQLIKRYENLGSRLDAVNNIDIPASDYQRYSTEVEYLLKAIEEKKKLVAVKDSQVISARELLNEAAVQRKIFQTLVQKHNEKKAQEVLRKEQTLADEHSSIRHSREE